MRSYSRCIAPTRPPKSNIIEEKISVILLSGGINYKMRSIGPTPLFKIGEDFLINYQIKNIKKVIPNSEIIVVIGWKANKVIKKDIQNIRLVENQLYEYTNEVEQLRLALNNIETNDVIIIKGTIFFNVQAIQHIITKPNSTIVLNEDNDDDIGMRSIDNKVKILSYDIKNRWGGILRVRKKHLKLLKNICNNIDFKKYFLFEAVNILVEKTELNSIYSQDIKIINIETFAKLREANENINS